jgi:hypothetical protein
MDGCRCVTIWMKNQSGCRAVSVFGRLLFTATTATTTTGTAGGAQILGPLIRRNNKMILDDSPIVHCYCCFHSSDCRDRQNELTRW